MWAISKDGMLNRSLAFVFFNQTNYQLLITNYHWGAFPFSRTVQRIRVPERIKSNTDRNKYSVYDDVSYNELIRGGF